MAALAAQLPLLHLLLPPALRQAGLPIPAAARRPARPGHPGGPAGRFARTDLAEQATRAIHRQATDARDRAEGELAAVRSEIDQAEAAIERYLGAFEAGTLPEAQCGKRVQALGAKLADLQARELELQQALAASATQELPTPADLAELASQLRQVIEHAPSPPRRPSRSSSSTRSTSPAATTSGRSFASPHARNFSRGAGEGS